MERRNASAEVFGTVVTDHGKAFGAGALQMGANIGDALSTGNAVSNKLNDWSHDIEQSYSPVAKEQNRLYDEAINKYQQAGYPYGIALSMATADHPYGASMSFTKEVAPGFIPFAGAVGKGDKLLTVAPKVLPAGMAVGALDGAGEVNRDYYEKTGDINVPAYITTAGALLGAIQGPISSSLGEGVLPVVKDWTPDNRTTILSPLEPLPQKQIWGLR